MKIGILGSHNNVKGYWDEDVSAASAPGPETPVADDAGAADTSAPSATTSAIAGSPTVSLSEAMPEKFRVFEGEGDAKTFNLESSAKKLLDSYSALEKRNGAPESPDHYNVDGSTIGENFNFDDFKKDEVNQAFLKSMHAAGLNNNQVQKVLEYGMKELIPGLTQGNQVLSQDDAINHMKNEVWKDGGEFQQNMTLANRAYSSLPPEIQEKINDSSSGQALGNHPAFLEVMAMFGKEMREDRPVVEDTGMGDAVEVEKLMQGDAYRDPKHPEHQRVSQQVQAYFKNKFPEGN